MTDVKQDLETAIKLETANEIATRFGFKVEFKPSEINLILSSQYQFTLHSVDEFLGFMQGFEAGRAVSK